MDDAQHENARPLIVLLHFVFLLSGIATVLIGQVLPALAGKFALNDLQLSFFFPMQFAGSLAGTFLTNRFAKRNALVSAVLIGCIAMALGLTLMNLAGFTVCLFGFLVNGIGIGLTLPSANMLVLEMNPQSPGSALNILNFCWGVGAILCKPFVDFLSDGTSIMAPTLLLALLLVSSAAGFPFFGRALKTDERTAGEGVPDDQTPIWSTSIAWGIALFNFVHVGFESGMGGWLTTYTDRVEAQTAVVFFSPTLLYFLFFVIGRGVAPIFFRFLHENQMLLFGLLVMMIGMLFILSAESSFALSIGAVVAGFGTSWIFPTNVSRFSATFGSGATRRAMPLFLCGTLGAACMTWLIGFVSNQYRDLRAGMYVLIFGVVFLIVLQIGLAIRSRTARKSVAF